MDIPKPPHNLDISSYSLEEVYSLFHLTPLSNISLDDLKNAKKLVLRLHPDKSKLSPDYFLFYKRALEIIVNYYNEQNKQNKPVVDEIYRPITGQPDNIIKQVKNTIKSMENDEFHSIFNRIFEENMVKKIDDKKNEWFSSTDPKYNMGNVVGNGETIKRENMATYFEKVKEQQKQQGLILHRGVENIRSHSGTTLYEDEEEENQEYISAQLFGRLKYDDLRKVHKDQTVFSVSENDYNSMPKYNSVEQYQRARGVENITVMNREDAEHILTYQEKKYRENMMKKQFESQKKTDEYGKINQQVLSNFLFLQN
jgi:hypothetical protein